MLIRLLRKGAHNLLMPHKSIRAEMHEFTFPVISILREPHFCALTAKSIHKSQLFQIFQLHIRKILQDRPQRVGLYIGRSYSGCILHSADPKTIQNNYHKSSVHFCLP